MRLEENKMVRKRDRQTDRETERKMSRKKQEKQKKNETLRHSQSNNTCLLIICKNISAIEFETKSGV